MINALLTASMLVSFTAVPFTANAAVTSLPVIQVNEKMYEVANIKDLDTIRNMINDFITESKIGLKVVAKDKISEKYADKYVFLRWHTNNVAEYDIFGEFLANSNIDNKLLQFIPFNPDDEETELNRISKLLYYYVKDNNIPATIWGVDPEYTEDKVTVEYYWKNENVPEIIKTYLAENNIDVTLINFAVEESATIKKITDLDTIEKLLADYIAENHLDAKVYRQNEGIEEIDKYVYVSYYYSKTDVADKIKAFIVAKNIDSDLIFYALAEDGKKEPITDLDIIEKLLSDYIAENHLDAKVYRQNEGIEEIDKYVYVSYYYSKTDVADKIKAFIEEKNINSDFIYYALAENTESVKGDANCDGQLDMADAVLIMQALANPNKYGLDGTAEVHLTEQGKINGDMDGDGLTVGDAQAIQKILLGLE